MCEWETEFCEICGALLKYEGAIGTCPDCGHQVRDEARVVAMMLAAADKITEEEKK